MPVPVRSSPFTSSAVRRLRRRQFRGPISQTSLLRDDFLSPWICLGAAFRSSRDLEMTGGDRLAPPRAGKRCPQNVRTLSDDASATKRHQNAHVTPPAALSNRRTFTLSVTVNYAALSVSSDVATSKVDRIIVSRRASITSNPRRKPKYKHET